MVHTWLSCLIQVPFRVDIFICFSPMYIFNFSSHALSYAFQVVHSHVHCVLWRSEGGGGGGGVDVDEARCGRWWDRMVRAPAECCLWAQYKSYRGRHAQQWKNSAKPESRNSTPLSKSRGSNLWTSSRKRCYFQLAQSLSWHTQGSIKDTTSSWFWK
jgi:hypothetical protein